LAKKKKPQDKGQTSLFSFVQKPKEKKEPVKKPPKKEEIEEPPEEKVPEKIIEKIEPEKTEKPKKVEKIPDNKFFKGDDTPFGLLDGDIQLEQIRRESFSSKYIRYLIKKGEIITDLERGLLLDVDYDGGENKAYCKFYDLDTDEIKIWIDSTNHEPYCYSRDSIAELETNIELTNYEGFVRFEEVKRYDLLRDKEISMTKIYGKTPIDIGGSRNNIKNMLDQAWEADIRYHLNYIYDTGIIPGLVYTIKNNKLIKLDFKEDEKESEQIANELKALFKDESSEMIEFAEKNLDIFLTPIPDIKRMALDIEVSMGEGNYGVPDPKLAKQEVISVSFVATDGMKKVYILERDGFTYGTPHEKFPSDGEVIFFKTEKELLTETFRLIWEYPVVITFNGDNFDFPYLFNRANKFKIKRDLNPIQVKRGFGFLSRSECDLRRGIHIDVFSFFANRSISGYAFSGAYERKSLNAISAALLGEEKYQHEEEIHDMTYSVLAWYNLKDSLLTLDLTKFNSSLVWNLLMLLCRITKMPMHDMVRHQISAWIKNIIFFEHRRNNYLIPRRSEISEMKKGGYSKATIEGKGFQGAYVIPPIPGIHYEVVVMDFASLYPSIIKEYNLSYETVKCPHDDCKENMVKGIPYHVCTHKMGIFAYIVGFLRDIRVKYFKPKSGDKSLTPERRSYNNTIQQALKVFINGSYGVFGSKNFPLFCLPVAESTTGIGQYSIKATIDKSEEMGVKVLYGDTDSVFLLSPSKKQMKDISEWSKKELDLDLEEEKTYQFLALSKRKKNYVGIYKDTKHIDIKGLVAKKSNTPYFIRSVFNLLTEILKNITNNDEFSKARSQIIEIIRNNQKKIGKPDEFTLEDYAINIGMQKKIESYDKVIPQHIRAVKEYLDKEIYALPKDLSDRDRNRAIKSIKKLYEKGSIVSFIKTKGAIGAKVIGSANLRDIDTKKYQDLLKSALEQVLDALGISFDEIRGIKKMDAFF